MSVIACCKSMLHMCSTVDFARPPFWIGDSSFSFGIVWMKTGRKRWKWYFPFLQRPRADIQNTRQFSRGDASCWAPPCVGANQLDRTYGTSPRALPLILAHVAGSTVTCPRHSTTTVPRICPVVCGNTARRASRASTPVQPFLYTRVVQKKGNNRWIYNRLLEING